MINLKRFTTIISLLLALVIITQPLRVSADENTETQNAVANSVKLIRAKTISSNKRGMLITFNTPVRFEDGQPSNDIFVSDTIQSNTDNIAVGEPVYLMILRIARH